MKTSDQRIQRQMLQSCSVTESSLNLTTKNFNLQIESTQTGRELSNSHAFTNLEI